MKAPVTPITGIEATPTESSCGAKSRQCSQMAVPRNSQATVERQNWMNLPYAVTNPKTRGRSRPDLETETAMGSRQFTRPGPG